MVQTILSLTLSDRSTASSRIRAHLPLDLLESRGHRVIRVSANEKLWPLRMVVLALCYRPKLVYIQKVMPPRALLALLNLVAGRLVFDLDDAIYLGYPGDTPESAIRAGKRFEAGLGYFDLVLTSNEQIRVDLGLTFPKCIVFPGPSPEILVNASPDSRDKLVMWLGSPSTEANINEILPALRNILLNQEFLLVGCSQNSNERTVHRLVWTETEEANALRRSHVGLMPLKSNVWNRRKAGYKILEYLRAGIIPVVEDGPILRSLLGDRAETLCEIITGNSAEHWAGGIERALNRECNASWLEARDHIFSKWSSNNFAELILDDSH